MLYSLFLIFAGLFPSNTADSYTLNAYDFSFKDIDGNDLKFKDYKGKVLLIVNVASKCGFTGQYEGLQSLYEKYKDKVEILAFPSNDFLWQEPGKNAAIKTIAVGRTPHTVRIIE